jgi:hypothetical protein
LLFLSNGVFSFSLSSYIQYLRSGADLAFSDLLVAFSHSFLFIDGIDGLVDR